MSPSKTRTAITIHVIRLGETAWAWELRDLDGSLKRDSARDGAFSVFANQEKTIADACDAANALLSVRIAEG